MGGRERGDWCPLFRFACLRMYFIHSHPFMMQGGQAPGAGTANSLDVHTTRLVVQTRCLYVRAFTIVHAIVSVKSTVKRAGGVTFVVSLPTHHLIEVTFGGPKPSTENHPVSGRIRPGALEAIPISIIGFC